MKTAAIALCLLLTSTVAHAFRPIWNPRNPLFEVSADQIATLHVSNLGDQQAHKVVLRFSDDQGKVLGSTTSIIGPGVSASLALKPALSARRVRPDIQVLGIGLDGPSPLTVIDPLVRANVELSDVATGRSTLLQALRVTGLGNATSAGSAGHAAVDVGAQQVARLLVVRTADAAPEDTLSPELTARLCFVDVAGAEVTCKTTSISYGVPGVLEVASDQRLTLRPVVKLVGKGDQAVSASLNIVDGLTGRLAALEVEQFYPDATEK